MTLDLDHPQKIVRSGHHNVLEQAFGVPVALSTSEDGRVTATALGGSLTATADSQEDAIRTLRAQIWQEGRRGAF